MKPLLVLGPLALAAALLSPPAYACHPSPSVTAGVFHENGETWLVTGLAFEGCETGRARPITLALEGPSGTELRTGTARIDVTSPLSSCLPGPCDLVDPGAAFTITSDDGSISLAGVAASAAHFAVVYEIAGTFGAGTLDAVKTP